MNVAVLGASQDNSRYAHRAQKNLMEAGYSVIPVSPKYSEILGVSTVKSLSDINETVDTLTIYIAPEKLSGMLDEILQLRPRRVIFNPGTEDQAIDKYLQDAGIETEEACTLVLLRTGQFES